MTFMGHFNQITNTLTEKFRSMADGKTVVNLFNEVNRATLDAIALVMIFYNSMKFQLFNIVKTNYFIDCVWNEYRCFDSKGLNFELIFIQDFALFDEYSF